MPLGIIYFINWQVFCRELGTKRKVRVPEGIRTHDLTVTGRVLNGGTRAELSYLPAWFMCACAQTTAKISNVQNVQCGDN